MSVTFTLVLHLWGRARSLTQFRKAIDLDCKYQLECSSLSVTFTLVLQLWAGLGVYHDLRRLQVQTANVSQSVHQCQSLSPKCYICGQGQEPTTIWEDSGLRLQMSGRVFVIVSHFHPSLTQWAGLGAYHDLGRLQVQPQILYHDVSDSIDKHSSLLRYGLITTVKSFITLSRVSPVK